MLLLLLFVGHISRSVRATLTHAATGLHAISTADMITKGAVIWTCTLVISLFVDYSYAQKLNMHWGPQSMMYLKGKHGRRFVSEDDNSILKQCVLGWYAVLRGHILIKNDSKVPHSVTGDQGNAIQCIQKLQSLEFKKPSHILSSEKVLIQYLQER